MRKGDVRLAVGITVVGITSLILSFASLAEKDQSESLWSPGDAFLEAGPGKKFSDTFFPKIIKLNDLPQLHHVICD